MKPADRRNAFLVLGVPYGSSRADATAAFALRSRKARRDSEFPYSVDDLTWALHQVESVIDNPEADLDTFRVPAEPSSLSVPQGAGLLTLPPTPLARRTEKPSESDLMMLTSRAEVEAIEEMLDHRRHHVRSEYSLDVLPAPVHLSVRGRRRGALVIIAIAALVLAAVAAAVVAIILGRSDEHPASTSVSASASASTSTETTLPAPTTPTTLAPVDIGPISTLAPDDYTSARWLSVFDIPSEPGTCFSLDEDPADPTAASATTQNCVSRHRYQVFSTFDIGPEIVNYADVESNADSVCAWTFGPFVGTAPSESLFIMSFFMPIEENWPSDRQVICYLMLPDERAWIGTAQNSAL